MSIAALAMVAAKPGPAVKRIDGLRSRASAVRSQITGLERQLQAVLDTASVRCLEAKFSPDAKPSSGCGGLEERVSEGQILLELKDYERASILLFDAVETPGFDRSSVYDDAVNALAEALYGSGNLVGARTYFRLLVERGSRIYGQRAIVRLIEITGRLNDYGNVDVYYDAYLKMSGASVRPEIAYVRGKQLVRAGRYDDAIAVLATVPRSNAAGLKAAYLQAVALIGKGGKEATGRAIELFRSVGDSFARNPEEKEVQELAWLALGRLYYDLGDLTRSADSYQNIPRESSHFPDMLFEVTWTFIKRGQTLQDKPEQARAEFQKAVQALDILLIAAPGSRLGPDINILRGNLYLRLGEHDKASAAFEGVIGEYRPTMEQLEKLMTERGDAKRLLHDIMAVDERMLTVDSLLPPLAAKWAQGQEAIDDALHVYKDLRVGKNEVEAARGVIARLNRVLDSPDRVELFPVVTEVHTATLLTRDRALQLVAEVTDLQGELLRPYAGAGYAEAVARRKALENKFGSIPKTAQGLSERANRIGGRIDDLDRQLFRLSIALDSQLAVLAAIDKYAVDLKAGGKLDPADEEYWISNLNQVRAAVEQMKQEHDQLAVWIRREREGLTLAGGSGSQESEIRAQLQEALGQEAALVNQARARAPADVVRALTEIDAVSVEVDSLVGRANRLAQVLEQAVDRRADVIRRAIAVEQGRLDGYERQVLAYENEAGDAAASAAARALKGVRDEFYDFVLRADVGLVDMAWQKKKEKSDEISRLVKKERAELKAMDQEFGEVLQAEE
ncbi:MAG: hypothetical protein JXR83_18345 [Deltaproteobacteria bacterium]|nr:hypothetical protein [Deltaproteobacteria bacterium]